LVFYRSFFRAVRQVVVAVDPAAQPDVEGAAGVVAFADVLAPFQLGAGMAFAGAGGGGSSADAELAKGNSARSRGVDAIAPVQLPC
jgi:hypothetical protein